MPETTTDARSSARPSWPDGLDETRFLERHWQREPCLLRQFLPGFETPLPPDELAGLALEPDTTPRLIRRDARGRFSLEHGPFEEEIFATLGPRDWSLLVTDVEKHLPELADRVAPFRVAPDWRFDDLMVSYAPDGASVGAHVDEYDVFLLQASGTRRWSIDARTGIEHASVTDGDLRLVADFTPTDSWELVPGDVLYLPPGIPHHGVALGDDCTTWSIGFRAPSAADVVLHAAELVAERLAARTPPTRLRDDGRGRGRAGEIGGATVDAVATLLHEALALDRATLAELTGRLLTRSGTAADDGSAADTLDDDVGAGRGATAFVATPFAQLAWLGDGERVGLFVNGERHDCARDLARRLCERRPCAMADVGADDAALVDALRAERILVCVDD